MRKTEQATPFEYLGASLARGLHSLASVLIGAYFLAMAASRYFDPDTTGSLSDLVNADYVDAASIAYLVLAAVAVMTGLALRAGVLAMALYLFWSAWAHFDATAPAMFWRDVSVLALAILIVLTAPATRATDAAPRRLGLRAALCAKAPTEEAEITNLFADLWDTPANQPRRVGSRV